MSLPYSHNIVLNIMKLSPNLGKTKLMKIVYMLQQVKNLNLGYDFDIYTYGPYSSEVLESVDELINEGLVLSNIFQYSNYVGYKLSLTDEGTRALSDINDNENSAILDILSFAEVKTARELELCSTIVFIYNFYSRCKQKGDQIAVKNKVHEIKPHFDEKTISNAYQALVEKKYIGAR